MSVLVVNRTESKFEVLINADRIHDLLLDLIRVDFGVKDLKSFVRRRYGSEDGLCKFVEFNQFMNTMKNKVNATALKLSDNITSANTIHPVNMEEYEKRRGYQDEALINCEVITKDLQKIVNTFDVNVNLYRDSIKAIDREIGLIKKWRQGDNKIKSRLKGNI